MLLRHKPVLLLVPTSLIFCWMIESQSVIDGASQPYCMPVQVHRSTSLNLYVGLARKWMFTWKWHRKKVHQYTEEILLNLKDLLCLSWKNYAYYPRRLCRSASVVRLSPLFVSLFVCSTTQRVIQLQTDRAKLRRRLCAINSLRRLWVTEMTFKRHSRSSGMTRFDRAPMIPVGFL